MIKKWGIFFFILGGAAVFMSYFLGQGIPAKRSAKIATIERPEGILISHLHEVPPVLRLRQDGAVLFGPLPAISDLAKAGEGTFAWKGGNQLYIRPFAAKPLTFTLDERYELPAWATLAGSLLAAVGLLLMLGGGSVAAAPVHPGGKVPYLDGLRGMACLVVFFFHYCWAYVLHMPLRGDRFCALLAPFPFGVLLDGDFCVEVFFVLSGFVLSLPYFKMEKEKAGTKLRAAIIRRPFRLLGMMLPVLVLAYLLGYGDAPQGWTSFLKDMVFSPFERAKAYVLPFWTLWWELYGSLGVFVGLWMTQGMSPRRRAWVYAWGAVLLHQSYFFNFLAGMVLAEAAAEGIFPFQFRKAAWLSALGVVFGLWLAVLTRQLGPKSDLSHPFLMAMGWITPLTIWGAIFLVVGALNLGVMQDFLNTRVVQFLGHISYALYAIHWLVIYSIAKPINVWLVAKSAMPPELIWAGGWGICVLCGAVLGWAGTRWIDQPAIQISKRIAGSFLGLSPQGVEAVHETRRDERP